MSAKIVRKGTTQRKRQKAKEEHYCFACPVPIQPGDHYLRTAQRGEGGYTIVRKFHIACAPAKSSAA